MNITNALESDEVTGPRLTVYHLFADLIHGEFTESQIAGFYDISPELVARARAYIFQNFAAIAKRHEEIEARNAKGNSPEVLAEIAASKPGMILFKQWLQEGRAFRTQSADGDETTYAKLHQHFGRPPTYEEFKAAERAKQNSPVGAAT